MMRRFANTDEETRRYSPDKSGQAIRQLKKKQIIV